MITSSYERCFVCGAENTIVTDYINGQIACTNCACVLDDRVIDETSEWRNFSNENPGNQSSDPNRVGGPINPFLDEINLTTTISTHKNSGTLAKWKYRSLGSGNRSLLRGFKKLDELAAKLDLLTSIVEKSKDTLKKVEESKKLKGRSLDSVIAAIFFYACRQCNAPRTIKDIVQALKLEKKDVTRCYNSIRSIIQSPEDVPILTNTIGLVSIYCNKLGVDNKTKKAANDIAEQVCQSEIIAGRNPSSVAAASICFALNLINDPNQKILKKDIAVISKTTENTIQSAFLKLLKYKSEITPPAWQELLHNLNN